MRFPKAMIRLLGRLHTPLYRLFRGRLLGRVGTAEVGLLTTIGRRSRRARTAPVLVVRDGERFIVVASQGGHDTHPAWYLNLVARPEASLRIRDRTTAVVAEELDGEARAQVWPRLVAAYPAWSDYEGRTTRRFPVMALTPSD